MSFIDMLKTEETDIIESTLSKTQGGLSEDELKLLEKNKTPEEILRDDNIKIKMVTPTSFGTQIDFSKKYDDKVIKDLLKDFNIKIKDKSVFIVE